MKCMAVFKISAAMYRNQHGVIIDLCRICFGRVRDWSWDQASLRRKADRLRILQITCLTRRYSVWLYIYPIHGSLQSAQLRDWYSFMSLAAPLFDSAQLQSCGHICFRLCKSPVFNWWACAIQTNQHSWSLMELQTYNYIHRSQSLSPLVWFVASH